MAPSRITPSGDAASSGELRGLTGLRIVAAVWVVVFHFHFTPLPGVTDVVGVLGPLITSGALGVDLFFVLSGFVIAHTYLAQLGPALRAGATARFVWARACRLWPVYVLVLHLFGLWLVARLAFGSDGDIAFQSVQPVVDTSEYVQQLFMVQLWSKEFIDGASWVGSTWSISAEWLAYLLFPVAALGFFRMRNLPVPVLVTAGFALMTPIACAYLSTGSPYYPFSWAVRILCGFGAGVLAYLVVRRLNAAKGGATDRVRRNASTVAAAVPVAVVAGLGLGELVAPGRGGAVIVLFPLLVGALALADRGPALLLSSRFAVYGGRVSYCLYLVHIPMFEFYWLALRRFGTLAPGTMLAHVVGLAVLVATFPVAGLVFHAIEEPARRRLRRLAEPRRPVPRPRTVVVPVAVPRLGAATRGVGHPPPDAGRGAHQRPAPPPLPSRRRHLGPARRARLRPRGELRRETRIGFGLRRPRGLCEEHNPRAEQVDAQPGSRRKTGRGRCRSTLMSTRNGAGAHTSSRRLRTASTTTAATLSGVVERGAGVRPSVMRVCTKPGRTTVTPTPVGRSASVSPE